MANVHKKNGVFHVRFRHAGKQFKRSLKSRDPQAAEAARHSVELTIYRIKTGLLTCPERVDVGDFIVSGGTLTAPPATAPAKETVPTVTQLIEEYLGGLKNAAADSYYDTQAIHLGHLRRGLGPKADQPCDRISLRDLDQHLHHRLAVRTPTTVGNERVTIKLFFKWLVTHGYLAQSPAVDLPTIKGSGELAPFRTMAEINQMIERGGLSPNETVDLWDCLYLNPEEIATLLHTVRQGESSDFAYLLHAIPAYTGMRRGEILRLTWQDIDFDRQVVFARSRKQSRRKTMTVRSIDIHPELTTELLAWREQRPRGQYVVCLPKSTEPLSVDEANRGFWQPMRGTSWCLDRRKNWYKVGFHTYRHSFVSNLAARGVDQRVIDEWVGHTTDAMRRRYRHLFPNRRREAITTFSLAVTE